MDTPDGKTPPPGGRAIEGAWNAIDRQTQLEAEEQRAIDRAMAPAREMLQQTLRVAALQSAATVWASQGASGYAPNERRIIETADVFLDWLINVDAGGEDDDDEPVPDMETLLQDKVAQLRPASDHLEDRCVSCGAPKWRWAGVTCVTADGLHMELSGRTDSPTNVGRAPAAQGEEVPTSSDLPYAKEGDKVRDKNGHVWTVIRDGGMVTRSNPEAQSGMTTAGIQWLQATAGPLEVVE